MEARTKSKRKRKNAFQRYFTPFGLRQFCDILMVVSTIVVIVGLAVRKNTGVVLGVGISMFLVGSLLAAYRATRVLTSGINKRSPEYKAAIVNTIIMGVLAATAIVGLLALIIGF